MDKSNLEIPGTAGLSESNKTPSPASLSRCSSQRQKNLAITHDHGTGTVSATVGLAGGENESIKTTITTSSCTGGGGSGGTNTASAACAKYLNQNGHHNNIHHHNNLNQRRELLKPNNVSGCGLQQQQHRRALNQTKPHKGDDAKKARKQVFSTQTIKKISTMATN